MLPVLRDELKQIFEVVIFDIGLFGFVIDGQQVNGVVNDLNIGNDTGTAGLAFAFGSDRQPYFVAMIADGRSLVGLLPEGADEFSIFFFKGGIFFSQAFELSVKRRDGQDAIVHRGALWRAWL